MLECKMGPGIPMEELLDFRDHMQKQHTEVNNFVQRFLDDLTLQAETQKVSQDAYLESCENLRLMGWWVPEEKSPGPYLWLPKHIQGVSKLKPPPKRQEYMVEFFAYQTLGVSDPNLRGHAPPQELLDKIEY